MHVEEPAARLLEISQLEVTAHTPRESVKLLRGVDLWLDTNALGVVGESGSGKSMMAAAILSLLPPGIRSTKGSIRFAGRELLGLPESEMQKIRGRQISIVYQNAVTSLNPLISVGDQIARVCRAHAGVSPSESWNRAVEMLASLGIADATNRARDYPHQFSGGMAQRVAIGAALICGPKLLIADEPTTGLDATIQVQVLDVITESVRRTSAALLLISHDLGVIQATTDSVVVLYAGLVMEIGRTQDVISSPLNPYTQGLVRSLTPKEDGTIDFIPGRVPEPQTIGEQCPFASRCPLVGDRCRVEKPLLRELRQGQWVACHNI
ncbi:MAG: ABC transporter ATP-binding protein [Candidatus Dormibacteraceae bacterium]